MNEHTFDTYNLEQLKNAGSTFWSAICDNWLAVSINLIFWLIGFIMLAIAKSTSKKINYPASCNSNSNNAFSECIEKGKSLLDNINSLFLEMKKSEMLYFYLISISFLFLVVTQTFIKIGIEKEKLTEAIILSNTIYLFFSVILPQFSRIRTYYKFMTVIKKT